MSLPVPVVRSGDSLRYEPAIVTTWPLYANMRAQGHG